MIAIRISLLLIVLKAKFFCCEVTQVQEGAG